MVGRFYGPKNRGGEVFFLGLIRLATCCYCVAADDEDDG